MFTVVNKEQLFCLYNAVCIFIYKVNKRTASLTNLWLLDYCIIVLSYPTIVLEWSNHSNHILPQTDVWIDFNVIWASKFTQAFSYCSFTVAVVSIIIKELICSDSRYTVVLKLHFIEVSFVCSSTPNLWTLLFVQGLCKEN